MHANEKAALLRSLHVPGRPVVLPNAWDAASAHAVVAAGFAAVATSSAAVAAVLGWEDGETTPVEEVLAAVARITRVIDVPVTVDFERGYGLAPDELVERFAGTGAVGLNLEDSDPATGELVDVAAQADFLASVREAARARGVDLVVNARADAFLRRAGTPDEQLETSVDRGGRYLAAGADCVYPLGVGDLGMIRELASRIPGPVNIGRGPASGPSLADLAGAGVARVSFGPSLQRQVYGSLATDVLARIA